MRSNRFPLHLLGQYFASLAGVGRIRGWKNSLELESLRDDLFQLYIQILHFLCVQPVVCLSAPLHVVVLKLKSFPGDDSGGVDAEVRVGMSRKTHPRLRARLLEVEDGM
jgi:hypothetical protein